MDKTALRSMEEARWCKDALSVQNASNISGVAHSLADLCVAMHAAGLSTTAICDHPATQLFVAKLADLSGVNYFWPASAALKAQEIADRTLTTATPSL